MIAALAGFLAALGGGWSLQVSRLLGLVATLTAVSRWWWLPEIVAGALAFALTVTVVHLVGWLIGRPWAAAPVVAEGKAAVHGLLAISRPATRKELWLVAAILALAPALARADAEGLTGAATWYAAFVLCLSLFWFATALAMRLLGRAQRQIATGAWHLGGEVERIVAALAVRIAIGLAPLIAISTALAILAERPAVQAAAGTVLRLTLIAAVVWVLLQVIGMLDRFVTARFRLDVADNLQARRIHTQATVVKKLLYLLVGTCAVAAVLMQFEAVRILGTSILASAGLASVIIGFAAQRTLANLLAGVQLAFTQPIRMDDVVVIEGEWGRIEEINLSYVVVALWDQRRLVLPISSFIEKPFQNWTRSTSQLLGTVLLRLDYHAPIEALRAELARVATADLRWDKRVCALQVTDCGERTIEVRALVSAADASQAFDLRCAVREALLGFLRREHPQALPRLRVEADVAPGTGAGIAVPGRPGDLHANGRLSATPREAAGPAP